MTDQPTTEFVATVNGRGEVQEVVFLDDRIVKAMADTILRNERYRAGMAEDRERRKYQRRFRRAAR